MQDILIKEKQLHLFTTEHKEDHLEELFQVYFDCRKNKRNTINTLKFEHHFDQKIFRLHEEIISQEYKPKRSIAFIANKPVQRETFSADFRDSLVHHFLINKLNPFSESHFIHDSYACLEGKCALFGVRRVFEFIKKCSQNYT